MYSCFKMFFSLAIICELITISYCHKNNMVKSSPEPDWPMNEPFVMDNIHPPKPGWVDPFDMLGESNIQDRSSLFVQSDVEIHVLKKRCSSSETYLRRFVNLFVNAAGLRDDKTMDLSTDRLIRLEMLVSNMDVKVLIDYGQGQAEAPSIEDVNDVITKIFSRMSRPQGNVSYILQDTFLWLQEAFMKIISSPEWTVLSSVALLLVMTLWLVYHSRSYKLAVFTLLLTIFLAGFGFTWIRMYEDEEVKRYVAITTNGAVPKHCSEQAQSMAWYEHMYHRMFGVNCLEFYRTIEVRTIVKISPTDVLAETVSSMLVNPLTNIGKAYGCFVNSVIHDLSWWLRPIALPFVFFTPLVFIIILLAFLFNYRFSLSITGVNLIPTRSHLSESAIRQDTKYVEECPPKETGNSQQNPIIQFLEGNSPMFLMNWKALKKLSSNSLSQDVSENKIKEETETDKNVQEGESLEDSHKQLKDNWKDFEEFLESMEIQKSVEERKKRSIHTCTEGESSLASMKSDTEGRPMITYADLPPAGENRTSSAHGRDKDFKDKTI